MSHVTHMHGAETHHVNWTRHSQAKLADKKDDDAGRKLNRTRRKESRAKGGNYGAAGKG